MDKADLIIHPIRLQLLRELAHDELTTQELAERLPDVPTSSIYRHLKLLLEGQLVQVSNTQLVKGIQKKTYRIAQPTVLGPADIANWTADDHLRYFTSYTLALIHDFRQFLSAKERRQQPLTMEEDRAGYREVNFYATTEELDAALQAINAAIRPLLITRRESNRRKYKLATVLHPIIEETTNE
jgi:DNA-binding transcriptional ArsR family regulator